MKALFLHSDYIKVKPRVPALKVRDEPNELDVKPNVLVVFVSVEEGDNEKTVENLIKEIKDIMEKVKAERVVLYPYAHLSQKLAKPAKAKELFNLAYELLKKEGIEVYKAPFGWYKEFEIKVKGHPLAELSREITAKEAKEEKKLEKRFLIVFPDGKEYLILGEEGNKVKVVPWEKVKEKVKDINSIAEKLPEFEEVEYLDKGQFEEDFVKTLEKEALGKPFEEVEKNPINEALRKFGFEWEPLSDYGHMRYKPYAALMHDLVGEYSIKIAKELPFPVFVIKGTNMFDLESGPVAEHAKLFGERMYEVKTDKSRFVLRYAACFQQFAMAKDLIISYKNLPFGMLEVADSYRFEQPGEVVLGFRLRKFVMPDLHVFTERDISKAKEAFMMMHKKIMEEIRKIGRDYVLLINVSGPETYEKYKDVILEPVKDTQKPAIICLYPPKAGYYWILNIEYHIADILGRPREIGTTQIDIGNGDRFGISYVTEKGEEKNVYIIHNAILGSVERYIYALIDTALRKEKPVLPLWISPVQVRVIPVSKEFLEKAREIAKELENNNIRVELDDRDETLGKKIREAERLWVPYIVVIGEKEVKENVLSVRDRYRGENRVMKLEELIKEIKEQVKGYPFKPLYGPMELSKRPANI